MQITKYADKTFKCSQCGTEVKITSPYDVQYGFIGFSEDSFLGLKRIIRGNYLICPCCYNKIILD